MINTKGLKEERQRLGLTQAAIAENCGISREMWCKYERGANVPSGDVLHAFLNLGGDVAFVLNGERSLSTISADEARILKAFRAGPTAFMETAHAIIQSL